MAGRPESNDGSYDNSVTGEFSLSKIDIRVGQRFISDQFTLFYEEQGYQKFPPGGLLATDDKSVIFTGATITPLKKVLEEGVTPPGHFMVQKCLRTKDINQITDISVIPDWTNYFTMCGILSAPGRAGDVSNEAYEFLIDRLGLDRDNILVQASSNDRDLSSYWASRGIPIEEDGQPESYYRWRYGMPNIYGRGINLLLRSNENDSYRDLGNIISVEDADGIVHAYEFGFGLESVLSKMYGFKKPMEASIVSTVIPYEEGIREKFVNALMTSTVLYHHGIEPGREREKYILKKLVKGLSFLRRKLGLSINEVRDYANLFEKAEFIEGFECGNKLSAGITAYENQLSKFDDYARNQTHAHKLKNDVGEYLLEKLRRQGKNMGILSPDINEVISACLS